MHFKTEFSVKHGRQIQTDCRQVHKRHEQTYDLRFTNFLTVKFELLYCQKF